MVQESESRFCSDQQRIFQALDPIHRSLLMNNSEFESINHNSINTFNQLPVSTCQIVQQQHQRQPLQQQQTQQEKQRRNDSIENKQFYDTSYLEKPDAPPCVSDSNCLTLFHEEFHTSGELECTAPTNRNERTVNEIHSRKKIVIRIVANKRRPCEHSLTERMSTENRSSRYDPKERLSSESQTDSCEHSPTGTMSTERQSCRYRPKDKISSGSQTDSSSYEYVDTDSEIELSSGAADERTENSGSNANTDEFSDYNYSNNGGSSSNDEAATTSSNSDSTAPMIQITQQITEERTVVSTVHVNKKKVKNFQKTRVQRATSTSIGRPKWINKQKIIDDNVCNEILDETINWDVLEGEKQMDPPVAQPPVEDTIIYGVLKAKPKYSHRKMGKLLEKRLARYNHRVNFPKAPINQSVPDIPSTFQPIRNIPPAKPPRTFTSSSSKASSDSIGANTATTVPIGDHKSLPSQHSPQVSPGGGWIFEKTLKSATKPTCPTLDEINDFEHPKKIGWVPPIPKRDEFLHVLNMLNDDHTMAAKMTSSNLTPEPQFQIPCKEDIDQVDSSVPPKPTPRRSKKMSMNESTICNSTPIKRANPSYSAPNSTRNETEFCKKCKLQIIEPSSARKSFGKGAIKRTKLFLQASRNMLVKSKPKPIKPYEACSENDFSVDFDDDVDETPRKLRLNTTADFNTDDTVRFEKKMEKTLDLTPKHSDNLEGPRRMLDKLLTSVKRTPPKKPIRQSLAHKDVTRSPSNNEEENFNFNRVVDSPKSKEREKSFRLSPRKLFFSANERSNQLQQNSYRSYETQDREYLKEYMVEYLRNMNEQIEYKQGKFECATPRWQSRVRNFSTSSDAIDYVPQHQRIVEIDCHPEPIYSEIVVKPPTTVLNHIIVNDNPKAIYTTVNKTRNRNVVDVDKIHTETQESVHASYSSLDKLTINNNFADSVLNMLALMKECNLDKDSQMREVYDLKAQQNAAKVASCNVVEPSAVQLTSERFQQSAVKTNDEANDDNISTDTFFTESLCEDVIRGDSVNGNIVKDIVSASDHFDVLVSEINLAEPETDDEIDLDCTTNGEVDAKGDSVEYCSIIDGNVQNSPTMVGPTQATEKSLRTHTNEAIKSGNRRNHKLQSPLVAAPSMIEIPDQVMLKLTGQIVAQREIRNQLKQAIQVCRTTKEFECSGELIEAERLMLLSAKKETYAKLELTRIDYEENGLTASPAKCAGTVTLKNIEFDLKPEEMLDQIFQLSYVCVCSYRDQVVATHPEERNGNTVSFEDISLKIGSLSCSFEIKLEIFVLRLPRPLRKYSHESKYHLNKIPKKPFFSNPVKLFTNATSSSSKLIPDTEESRFRLRGVGTISANCLSSEKFEIVKNASWPKTHVYISYNTKSLNLKINDQFSNLTGALRTEFVFEATLSDTGLSGYINLAVGSDPYREMWCRPVGCTVECWGSDIDCLNGKIPILIIDLMKCTNELFELADNKFAVDIFVSEVTERTENRIKRYWLNANNQNDLTLWLTDLNRTLKFIKNWNIY